MNTAIRINIAINKALTRSLTEYLKSLNIRNIFVETGRTSTLNNGTGLFGLRPKTPLAYDPVEIVSIFVHQSLEDDLMAGVFHTLDLKTPGRGTIQSSDITIIKAHPSFQICSQLQIPQQIPASFFTDLRAIACVVQRGEGDAVARVSLKAGASVPVTTYGIGGGVRDKLGLLRITIPPEKEVIDLVMSKYDIDSVMEMFISEAKLDAPGRGIAYIHPIRKGTVNTRISRKRAEQAANMEQMISAIDSIVGGVEWRKTRLEQENTRMRTFLTDLVELILVCSDGFGKKLSKIAMENGASGATICKTRYIYTSEEDYDRNPPRRDISKMIVSPSAVPKITQAIEEAGGFEDEAQALLYSHPVLKAYTYRAKEVKRI
ncbi:MAG: hypothetical protein GX122_00725 [Candidatus Cloacimonetes bacterium]|nr:hypothetical protein [Candidatus Cloacimonadota bacterium]